MGDARAGVAALHQTVPESQGTDRSYMRELLSRLEQLERRALFLDSENNQLRRQAHLLQSYQQAVSE